MPSLVYSEPFEIDELLLKHLLYLLRTNDEIDSFLENRILAKNKKTKTATLKNIVTFQVEQTTIT